ncbi:SLAM family member 9-like [Acipenser oxyrinchus oxyrinchus]|uniref:SLAM family member 9-like n=1 Tax=Acipenser oxyrinchus oxyrinchus TaxID=40147 RepID=A0AAD8CH08_ACIOX|nr:SLAM family member 9-like [Acipenser oxyrinchus oxyrinchus]
MKALQRWTLLLSILMNPVAANNGETVRYGAKGKSIRLAVKGSKDFSSEELSWYFDNGTKFRLVKYDKTGLKPATPLRVTFNESDLSLTVNHLTLQDIGLYIAEKMDSGGQQTVLTRYQLYVQAPVSKPVIQPSSVTNASGLCNYNLVCTVEEGTKVSIEWAWPGVNSTQPVLSNEGRTLEFTQGSGRDDQIDFFTCYARNNVSNESTTIMKEELGCDWGEADSTSLLTLTSLLCLPLLLLITVVLYMCVIHKTKPISTADRSVSPPARPVTPDITTVYAVAGHKHSSPVYDDVGRSCYSVVNHNASFINARNIETIYDNVHNFESTSFKNCL